MAAVVDGALAYRIWGGRVSIGGTHHGEENDFNEYIRRIRAGTLPWSLHRIRFSDAIREGLYKRICLVTKKVWTPEAEAAFIADVRAQYPSVDVANEELECIPRRGSGAYFTRLLIEYCGRAVPVAQFRQEADFVTNPERIAITQRWIDETLAPLVAAMDPTRRTVVGQDFGRSGDLSVLWPLQAREIGLGWDTPFRVELRNIPFDCQKLITFWLLHNVPLLHHVKFDARGNGQSHAEAALQEFGAARVECVMLTGAWYDEHFPKYHQAYEDGEIGSCIDEDCIADHRSVVLVGGKPRMSDARTKGSDGGDRHGDAAVAGVLAWAAARTDAAPSAGETVEAVADTYRAAGRGGERPSIFGNRAERLNRPQRPMRPPRRGGGPT